MAVPATRLLVLSVVRMLGPVHGYDVRRESLSWQPGAIRRVIRLRSE
ncbi:hypothetical protein [Nocardia sp.]|nr:hypothetical protein [Nocardia sp.]